MCFYWPEVFSEAPLVTSALEVVVELVSLLVPVEKESVGEEETSDVAVELLVVVGVVSSAVDVDESVEELLVVPS